MRLHSFAVTLALKDNNLDVAARYMVLHWCMAQPSTRFFTGSDVLCTPSSYPSASLHHRASCEVQS
jgi:hypothetical protein